MGGRVGGGKREKGEWWSTMGGGGRGEKREGRGRRYC